uniref:DinB family protein n=1 Tax=Roseihalotalea indica TaxID=2867963 RepID=A0AA49JJF3_9BACT|nr:DinB family protein [Tunicatimonas sp. TK19036]
MEQAADKQLRQQLVKHLEGGEAFTPVDEIIRNIPFEKLGVVSEDLPYSFWQQFYHLRFAQYDILDFCRNPDYTSHNWPDDYWPDEPAPKNQQTWDDTVKAYFTERDEMAALISDQNNDLLAPLPHGSGQTLLREALLVIEHTAYHTGQLLIILRLLGLYK